MSSGPATPLATRGRIWAWAMYDWANSAYSTLLITVVVLYLTKIVFPEDQWGATGATVYAWAIGAASLLTAICSPIAGALADAQASKRWWLAGTALSGAALAVVMGLAPADNPWLIVALFATVAFLFDMSFGFYNGFLPELADEQSMDRVSAFGFALGYVGGGVALLVAMAILHYGESLGLPTRSDQLRAGVVLMGAWWGLFSLPAIIVLRDAAPPRERDGGVLRQATRAMREVFTTLRHIRVYRSLAWFLLGFLFYNDGVQTVLTQASVFAERDLNFEVADLALVVLMIQFVAFPGALLVAWLSTRFGQRRVLFGCLAVWVALLVSAWFVTTRLEFWIMGIVVAFVMGGIQSVSRAIFGLMTPPDRQAEFFGFFNLSGKAFSVIGPFIFGSIVYYTGNARLGVVSIVVQFVVGWVIVARADIAQGRRDALASGDGPVN